MAIIAYHASHEQFPPSELLRLAVMAEQHGFRSVHSSDHFHPWSTRQGQSGYSFAWLGAAMQATNIPYSVIVAPGQRYHPAVVAQAAATLTEMFPGRFSLCLGSGEAINEHITGDEWPEKAERNKRLQECATVIRQLFTGAEVNHNGSINVKGAKLYTLPPQPPLLIGAAVTKETAEWLGSWADGLLTVHKPYEELKEVVDAFRRGGGAGKPMYLKVQLSYAATEELALKGAHDQWRTNILNPSLLSDVHLPEQFDALAEFIAPEDLKEQVRISADPEQHIRWITDDLSLGFEEIILHNVNRWQEPFITDFGEKVLPYLKQV